MNNNILIQANSRFQASAVILISTAIVLSLIIAAGIKVLNARDAYLFAYPLVTMDVTGSMSERGVLTRKRTFPDASFRRVVRPNVDTLYTSGFFNVTDGPWVFEMKENTKRYEVMQFMDGWTNVFASIGTRTHGTKGGKYLIVGPGWEGVQPAGLTLIKSPTDIAWIIGRTQTNGREDLSVVHGLQDGLTLRTYDDWIHNRPERQSGKMFSTRESTAKLISQMGAIEFFSQFTALLEKNPPTPQDRSMMETLAGLGIARGETLNSTWRDQWAMRMGRLLAQRQMKVFLENERKVTKGWIVPAPILGEYGTNYEFRAVVAMVGLGANKREDAIYLQGKTDVDQRILSGSKRYRIHFKREETPPVNAFWSITAYGSDHYLIDNIIDRYSLGDRDALAYNSDGSLDIWIQAEPPSGEKFKNWLPVKYGESFVLSTRLYWPKKIVINGEWTMPPIDTLD
jgi:hypothetical protein